jgi:hypothetical protein
MCIHGIYMVYPLMIFLDIPSLLKLDFAVAVAVTVAEAVVQQASFLFLLLATT